MAMLGGGRDFQSGSYFLRGKHVRKTPALMQSVLNWSQTSNNKKIHSLILSCYGIRSLVGLLSLATVLPSRMGLLPLGAARGPLSQRVTRGSHGARSSQLG